ncbi:MAG: carbon storage regulator CsrA [Spirochaetia bacterium]|nr:carbon storage regulator CsrA [Spirochaetia bacterium]
MLVLARKKNQSIVINDDIEIFVVDLSHDQVKIGIKAPQNVTIHRKEIYESIKNENVQAALAPERIKGLGEIKAVKKSPPKDDPKPGSN